ncbi:unannotated protein [freshwater metagenome]|uniref:Unannotated protein n=1 Tax=freshwater metagenome TaxID=449393 RepID=A0A6J7EXV4_9ZZZZ|nr:hypothetical protein [Actinomycetota bacterium]
MTDKIKKLTSAILVLAITTVFILLGLWQLDRARELSASQKAVVKVDQTIYPLNSITSPNGALPVNAFGKKVTTSGFYVGNYKAPNQKLSDGEIVDLEVALMQVDTESAIVVVRGLWSERMNSPEIAMSTNVTITGTIYPSQYEDRAPTTSMQISRLDSSVLTSVTDFQLYDGFISADSESYREGKITRERVALDIPKGKVPGFYWQHISYVATWWIMAILVLWAPFYKRRENDDSAS